MLNDIIPSVIMLRVAFHMLLCEMLLCRVLLGKAACCDAECHYVSCYYAECRYTECRYTECRGTLFCFSLDRDKRRSNKVVIKSSSVHQMVVALVKVFEKLFSFLSNRGQSFTHLF
jgi:hypothetical protein